MTKTNEFKELIKMETQAIIEGATGYAFTNKQVEAITKELKKYFSENMILVREKEGNFFISLNRKIRKIAYDIKNKAKLLKQFKILTEDNKQKLCSATNIYHLDRICRDIFTSM